MEISFATKKLAKVLNCQKETLRTYGPDNGSRILKRLYQLASAEHLQQLSQLPQTRVHELNGDRKLQISIDVKHPYRLLITPNHEEIPRKPDGGLDWRRITRVTVLEIVDTHSP